MKISQANLEEYEAKLGQLHYDDEFCEEEQTRLKQQRDFIKGEVNGIADLLGSSTERVELILGGKGFDRQVRRLGGGLDTTVLESALGTKLYRELFCNRVVTYEFDEGKFDAARKLGTVNDATISKCMVEPKLSYVQKRIGLSERGKHD